MQAGDDGLAAWGLQNDEFERLNFWRSYLWRGDLSPLGCEAALTRKRHTCK